MVGAILLALKIAQEFLPLGAQIVTVFTKRQDGTITAETTFVQNDIKLEAGIAEGQAFLESLKKHNPLV